MRNMRYWLAILSLALLGGFLIVESQAFAPTTASGIAFAIAIAITLVALAASAMGSARDGRAFAALPALCALIGAWTIVAMNLFSALTEKWLAFASGAGVLGVALVALALHELTVERVVHSLEVAEPARTSEHPSNSPLNGKPRDPSRVTQHA